MFLFVFVSITTCFAAANFFQLWKLRRELRNNVQKNAVFASPDALLPEEIDDLGYLNFM